VADVISHPAAIGCHCLIADSTATICRRFGERVAGGVMAQVAKSESQDLSIGYLVALIRQSFGP
jgi:hypothetical protein